MSEVFGVVSAGVGVAAAAGQLIDGILKLHAFCARMRNIPDEIRTAIEDLSVMTELLAFVHVEMSGGNLPLALSSPASSSTVLSSLQQSSRQVAEVLVDMQKMVQMRRPWGRLKAVATTKKLEMAAKRAENAQRMVLLLLAAENRMMFRHGFSALERDVTALSTRLLTTEAEAQPIDKGEEDGQAPNRTAGKDADITNPSPYQVARGKNRTMGRNVHRMQFKLPTWLFEPVWEFSICRAKKGWDISLRSYNVRPEKAEIFEAIVGGDIHAVRELLNSGRAEISDHDPRGRGVLHFAASACAKHGPKMIEYLRSSGADIHDIDVNGFPAYFSLVDSSSSHEDDQMDLRIAAGYRAFMGNNGWSPTRPSNLVAFENLKVGSDISEVFPIFQNPPKEVVRSFLNEMWPPWKDMSAIDRLGTLFPVLNVDGLSGTANTLCMRECLSRDFVQSTFAQWKIEHRSALVYYVFEALGAELVNGSERVVQESRSFLQDMLASGGLLPTLRQRDTLIRFVNTYMWSCLHDKISSQETAWGMICTERLNNAVQEGLKRYLAEMLALNIGMSTLIEIERHTCERMTEEEGRRSLGYSGQWIETIKIDYGPSIEDWYIWFSNLVDGFAGQFWNMIEQPERTIPGAWIEDTS